MKRFFKAPVFEDEDKTRAARLLYNILVVFFGGIIIYSGAVLLSEPVAVERLWLTAFLFGILGGTTFLLYRGQVRTASLFFLVATWLFVTGVIAFSSGINALNFNFYTMIILGAGLLLGGRATVSFALTSALVSLGILSLSTADLLPQIIPPYNPTLLWIMQAISFLMVGALLYVASHYITTGFARARHHEHALADLIHNLTSVVYRCQNDRDWTFEYVSDAIQDLTGYAPADFIGHKRITLGELIHPKDRQRVWDVVQAALEEQQPFQLTYRITTAEQEEKWVWEQGRGLFTPAGELIAIEGSIADVTQRKQTEEALQRVNRAYHIISESHNAMMQDSDEDLMLKRLCQVVSDIGGYPLVWVGLVDQNQIKPVAHSGDDIRFLSSIALDGDDCEPVGEAARSGEAQLIRNIGTDPACGQSRAILVEHGYASLIALPLIETGHVFGTLAVYSYAPDDYHDEEVDLLSKLAEDLAYGIITLRTRAKRAQAEAALRDSEEKFRVIFDNGVDAIYVLEPRNATIMRVNKVVENTFGYAIPSLIGQPFSMLFTASTDVDQLLKRIHDSGTVFDSLTIVRQDGSLCPVDLHASMIPWDDGRAILMVLRDVSERRQMEEELLKAGVMEAELAKERELLELKEHFIATVSHQFRTPLTVMLSASELLENYYERLTEEKRLKYIRQVKGQIGYMTSLLDDVLFMSRASRGKLEFKPITLDLEAFARDEAAKLQFVDDGAHHFTFSSTGDLSQVEMDDKLLQHIISNLLSNAIKYTPQGKAISLSLESAGDQVILQISDQGIGIPLHDQNRLFEPFYRASNTGEISGTGLGLSIVKESVAIHGGTITLDSKENEGTTFTVYLPRYSEISDTQVEPT